MNNSNASPLVSILTPCFNSAEYLPRCVESVLAQDHPAVEHIIQDGASTDGTRQILEGYAGRVDWVSEPDAGQSDALNKALQRCRGEVILVLNADDELLPHAASWAVAQLAAFPDVAAVYGDQHYVGPDGQTAHEAPTRPPYDFARVLCVEDVPPAQAMFIRRSALEAVGWHADVSRKTCPDYEMLVRLGLKFPLRYVPGFVARYRVHPGSQGCQGNWTDEMVRSKREVMERVFGDPNTPASLRRLRRRALGGLLWWSADVFLGQGDVGRGLRRAAQALRVYPASRQWRKAPGFLRISLAVAAGRLRRKAGRRGRSGAEGGPLLTLFALPKPFEGHINVIQRNALESWTRLEPRPRILLFGDETGTAEAAREFGLCHVPEIERNEFGTPLVSDIFLQAQARSGAGVLCYVNADIMLMSDFARAVRQVSRSRKRFLMGGRRWTVDLPDFWDFSGDWEARLRALVDAHGTLDPPHSIDYFVFSAGFWTQIPPFAIGRFFWDNWLLYQCRARRAPLIQATPAVTIVHQSHGYNHAGTTTETLHQGPEARRNLELAGGGHHLYSLSLASHILTPQGLRRRPPGRWQIERWQHEWNHRSRRALEGLQQTANGPSLWRPLARAALWGFAASGTPRRRLGRAITRWREGQ